MNRLTKSSVQVATPKLISRMCKSRIPRFGEEGSKGELLCCRPR